MRIEAKAYPRIHISLIDMTVDGYRKHGGVGFSLDVPLLEMKLASGSAFDLKPLVGQGIGDDDVGKLTDRLLSLVESWGFSKVVRVESCSLIGRHMGLGSGTALSLALIESLFEINSTPIPSREYLRLASGRGGVSGVGIGAYFDGGLLVDIGHLQDGGGFLPSDVISPSKLPHSLSRVNMPGWPLGFFIPSSVAPLTVEQEVAFFRRVTPIELNDAYPIAYHAIFGVYGSVVDADYSGFCRAINALQRLRWKREEINNYQTKIWEMIESLLSCGADCVGMSSMGPGIYFFASDPRAVYEKASRALGDGRFFEAKPRNFGREILCQG